MDSFGDLTEVNTNVVLENLCVSQDLRLSRRDLGRPVSPALPLQAQRNTSSRASTDTCSFDLAVAFYQEIPLPCGFCSGSSLEDCLFNHCFVSEKTPHALAYVGRVCDPTCSRSFTAGVQPGAPARVTASPGPGSGRTAPVPRHCGKGWAGGKPPLAFASPGCLFRELPEEPLPQPGCWPCPPPEGAGRGSSRFALTCLFFWRLCNPGPGSSPPGGPGLLPFTAQGSSCIREGVSGAARPWGRLILKRNILEFPTDAKELKCSINLLSCTVNSH